MQTNIEFGGGDLQVDPFTDEVDGESEGGSKIGESDKGERESGVVGVGP